MFRVTSFSKFSSSWAVVQICIWTAHALDCKNPKGLTISSAADVNALNACTNITAPLTFTSSAPSDIQLNGPLSLSSLNATSLKSLHSISSSSLLSIGTIALTELPALHALNFSALNALDTLQLEDLPALENCTFGGLGPRNVVSIVNTGLEEVDFVKWPVSTSLNISSNPHLEEVSLPWDSIDGSVEISRNGKLESVDVGGVKGVSGKLSVEGNAVLKKLSFGGLASVQGDAWLSGGFSNVSMPVLEKVTGILAVSSTKDIDDSCAEMGKVDDRKKVTCTSNAQTDANSPSSATPVPSNNPGNPPSPSSSGNPDDGGDDSSDMATGAKIGIIIAAVILGLFVVVGLVFFLRARSRGKVREIVISAPIPILPPTKSSTPSVKSVDSRSRSVGEAESPRLESAEARVVGRNAGGVKVVLNGEEMREVDGHGDGGGGAGVGREASLRSVSSVGSEVPLVQHGKSNSNP